MTGPAEEVFTRAPGRGLEDADGLRQRRPRREAAAVKLTSPFAIGAWSLARRPPSGSGWVRSTTGSSLETRRSIRSIRGYRGAKIYVFWHENILMPLYLRGHSNISMLLSRHADANILDRVARMMGFGVVRGSTFRGGSAALRELADGPPSATYDHTRWPTGPRRRLAPGCVFLASTLRHSDRGDGARLRPALAVWHLGSLRDAAALVAGPGHGQPGDSRSARPRPRWYRGIGRDRDPAPHLSDAAEAWADSRRPTGRAAGGAKGAFAGGHADGGRAGRSRRIAR